MNSRQLEKYQATLEGVLREVLPSSRNGTGVRGARAPPGSPPAARPSRISGGCHLFFCFALENQKLSSPASTLTPPYLLGEPNHAGGRGRGEGAVVYAEVGFRRPSQAGSPIPQPGASPGPRPLPLTSAWQGITSDKDPKPPPAEIHSLPPQTPLRLGGDSEGNPGADWPQKPAISPPSPPIHSANLSLQPHLALPESRSA